MGKLTDEDIVHVAKLSKLKLNDNEVTNFSAYCPKVFASIKKPEIEVKNLGQRCMNNIILED